MFNGLNMLICFYTLTVKVFSKQTQPSLVECKNSSISLLFLRVFSTESVRFVIHARL